MTRLLSLLVICTLLTQVAYAASDPTPPPKFDILGASVNVAVTRAGTTLPATLVPYLLPGDTLDVSFPHGVQYSTSPRWHLVVADMYGDYLQHAPDFPIPDANLSRAKPGYVWRVRVKDGAKPILFLIPENGTRRGHGIPDARHAISNLGNRSLLLQSATLAASAQAKDSTLGLFLHSLASIQPGELPDARARIAAATQSLFGYDLADAACFSPSVPQSTQYACAAQAVASSYDGVPKESVIRAVGNQLPVTAATYGMLVGALYELLAKRRVDADYLFEPGVIKPGAPSTDVYVAHRPDYDPSASKPSTIVYFRVGSHATSTVRPEFGQPSAVSLCADSTALTVPVSFTGLPVYFRTHAAIVHAGDAVFRVPAHYDPLTGFSASLTSRQLAALSGGGTVKITSSWGFDRVESAPQKLVTPHSVPWTLKDNAQSVVMGAKGSITLTDGNAGMGACVKSVAAQDATGSTIPVAGIDRSDNDIAVHLDATAALGPAGSAVVDDAAGVSSPAVSFAILPPMPHVVHAVAYLPKGALVLQGTGLKYINAVTLDHTGITFGAGTPNPDGSWTFTALGSATYQPVWVHDTMAISYTLQPPDSRTGVAPADVQYAAPN